MESSKVGGYVCEISTEKYNCPLCKKVLRKPNLTSCCGEHACATCMVLHVDEGRPCPLSDCGELGFTVFLDKKWMREVQDQDVRCNLRSEGCDWAGKLRDFERHVEQDCRYVAIECPRGCRGRVRRQDLPVHSSTECLKRPYRCQHCGYEETYENVERHWKNCEKFPLACPNPGCEDSNVERCRLERHLSECPLQRVPCEFRRQGCTAGVLRRDYAMHMEENVQIHMKFLSSTCSALKEELPILLKKQLTEIHQQLCQFQGAMSDSQAKVTELQAKVTELQCSTAEKDERIHQLETISERKKDHNQMESFMQKVEKELRAVKNQQHTLEQANRDKDRQVQELTERLRTQERRVRQVEERLQEQGELTASLKSEYGNQGEETDPASASPRRQSLNTDAPAPAPSLGSDPPRPRIPLDSPVVRRSVTPSQHYTADFPLNIGSPPMYTSGSHHSPPFSTAKDGYSMQLDAYWNSSKGDLSIHLYVLRGDSDHSLKWPLYRNVTVQLVNPRGEVYQRELDNGEWSRVEKPCQKTSDPQSLKPFISKSELTKYISKQGDLHFRVQVDNY